MENLQELKPVGKLSPFAHFCCTIGNLPTSYMISLTYEEQLLWLCQYLEKTVIPAVNTNAEAVAELQNLYIQLKEYVDNYFTNLDVQEEINNKLDEMAQSGELSDIIAQYLELQGLLCYNNINEMKNATNIAEGSFTKTYGENTYNDGNGAFYKVRQLINTDIIDNINIVALTNYPTLVCERIPENGVTLKIEQILPEIPINNTQYEIIKSENNLNITEIPTSYYENLENARKLTLENTQNNLLKVATFNIENSNVPYDTELNGIKKLTKLQNIFNKIGACILGINETFDGTIYPANEFLTTEFLENYRQVTTWENIIPMLNFGEGILSSLKPESSSSVIYNSYNAPDHQGYVKNIYNFNNKLISFYCTHLCYNSDSTLRNQITELFNAVSSDTNPYKIIVGDFNFDLSQSNDYLVQFLNSGFKLVNGGQYKTYDDSRNIAIDEIMISSNINIVSSGAGNKEYIEGLSDHFPVWATLSFN